MAIPQEILVLAGVCLATLFFVSIRRLVGSERPEAIWRWIAVLTLAGSYVFACLIALGPGIPNAFREMATSVLSHAIGLVMVLGVVFIGIRRNRFDQLSGFLVSVGIAGTFVGVFFALTEVDWRADLPSQVPILLEGVGLALSTSVAGITLALLFRFILGARKDQPDPSLLIMGALDRQEAILTQQTSLLEALVGEHRRASAEDSSRHQSTLSRLDGILAAQDRTVVTLQDALDELSEKSVETIVDSLRSIVDSYNEHIQQQFGDTFKALNEAVHELTDWQRAHLEEIRSLHQILQYAKDFVQSLENDAKRHEELLARSDRLIAQIEQGLRSASQVASELERHLPELRREVVSVLDTIVNRFVAASADVEQRMRVTANALTSRLEEAAGHLKATVEKLFELPEQQRERIEALLSAYGRELEAITAETLKQIGDRIGHIVNEGMSDVRQAQKELLDTFETLHGLIGDLEKGVFTYSESVHDDVVALKKTRSALKSELSEVIKQSIQEVAASLALIHDHYYNQFEKVERDLLEIRQNGKGVERRDSDRGPLRFLRS